MKENESIESIVAEMRRREKSHYYPKVARNIMHQYADRIEAAWKRERDELVYAYDPTKRGSGRAPDGSAYALESMREPVTEHHAVGNSAAMREALKTIHDRVNSLDEECGVDPVEVRDLARAALSAPPRNCDVGTAEEQDNRMDVYCQTRKCESCPLWDNANNGVRCEFTWSQMPHEESEAAK